MTERSHLPLVPGWKIRNPLHDVSAIRRIKHTHTHNKIKARDNVYNQKGFPHYWPFVTQALIPSQKTVMWRFNVLFTTILKCVEQTVELPPIRDTNYALIVRRAGLLWSQQDFEWRWSVPLFKCLTVLEFSFILLDLCLSITFFNFIMNYVPIVTFWIFTYHKIWILSIMFCFIWSYWIIYFLACLEVSWRVVS